MTHSEANTSAADLATDDPHELAVAVLGGQIRQLTNRRIDLPANMILAALVSFTFWSVYPLWVHITWLALFTSVIVCRFLIRRRYITTAPAASEARRWGRRLTIGAFATGCLWGLTGAAVVLTADTIHQVFIVFMLGGMAAGGVVSHAAYMPTMLAFAVPTTVPVAVALLARGDTVQMQMGLMLAIFIATLIVSGRDINRFIIESLRIRLRQAILLDKLRVSEASMAQAQQLGKIGSWEIDVPSGTGTCSAETYRILGVDPASFKPSFESMLERVHPDDRAAVMLDRPRQSTSGFSVGADFRLRMDDGSIKYVHEFSQASFDKNGCALKVTGIIQDISERKKIESALQFSNTLLRSEMEASPDGILVVTPDRKIVSFNQRFATMWHLPLADMTSEVDKHVFNKVVAAIKDSEGFRSRVEYLHQHPDEQGFEEYETLDGRFIERHSSTLTGPNDAILGRVWYFRDITERKKAAISLAYRDNILHAITLCVAQLVAGKTLEASLPGALKILAEALDVDRTIVFKQSLDGPAVAILASWQRDDVPTLVQDVLAAYPGEADTIGARFAPLARGEPLVTLPGEAPGFFEEILRGMNVQSNLLVPITVSGHYWGNIAIDDCRAPRRWSHVEIDSLTTLADITGTLLMREQINASLQTSEERFRAVTETAQDAIIMMDAEARITYWNPAAEKILGYTAGESIGHDVHEWLIPERYRAQAIAGIKKFAVTGRGPILGKTLELAAVRKGGTEFPIELSTAAIQKGRGWEAVAVLRDITARKNAERELVRMARHDVLTGLANRGVFVEVLQQRIALSHRGGSRFAVLYLDLDHFKDVNDTLGHPVGDALIKAVAKRLQKTVREADTVARFGGDEFAIVAADIKEAADAALLADKILAAVSEPFSIEGNEIRTGASIGIALFGSDSRDAELLLSHADVALYRAKAEGRSAYRFFTEAMDAEVRARVTLGAQLRIALGSNQLFLEYQPQVDINTCQIVGLEALVRWNHPTRGRISPDELVPIAEKTGLIVELGNWVLRKACGQMKVWLDAGIAPPIIAVNVSTLQFRKPFELEEDIAAILAETGLPTSLLELELTESVFMGASREHNDVLLRLRESGLRVAIDDFGTGYSSLEYLGRFPVDRIKIGQTFMRDLSIGSPNAKIVKAAIRLAHDLGLDVIVEGVETAEQLKLIRSWNGIKVQGYYYYRPLPVDEATAALRLPKTLPAANRA